MKTLAFLGSLLLLLSQVRLTYCTCSPQTSIDSILQDSVTLRFDKIRQKYSYQYPGILSQDQIPSIILSISKLQMNIMNGIQYHIATLMNAGKSKKIIFYCIFPMSSNVWKQLRIDLWIIDKKFTNLAIGYFIFQNILPSTVSTLNHTQKDLPLISKLNDPNVVEPVLFTGSIMGISATFDHQFQVGNQIKVRRNVSDVNFKSHIQLSLNLGASLQVKLIRISYVLFIPQRLSNIRHQFGKTIMQTAYQNERIYQTIQQRLIVYPLVYKLIGFTGLKFNKTPLSFQINILAGNVELIELVSASKLSKISLNYLILGIDMMMACINCPESFVRATKSENLCVSRKQCASDQINLVDKQSIYYSCRKCVGDYQIKLTDKQQKYCECRQGYKTQLDGKCTKIEVYKSLAQCADPYAQRQPLGNKCICKQGYTINQFGFCSICDQKTSYEDLNSQECICFPGFQKGPIKGICITTGQSCGINQVYKNGVCQCVEYTVKRTNSTFSGCIQCQSGTFISDDKKHCIKCNLSCSECVSEDFCLVCQKGFYFRDFQCLSRCGDGYRTQFQACDDGNIYNQDGCSSQCLIQNGFECKQDILRKSKCSYTSKQNIKFNVTQKEFQKQKINLKQVNQDKNNISISQNINTINVTKIEQNKYKLSLTSNSPIVFSSGIVVEFIVKPQKKRDLNELKNMVKVQVNDPRCQPPSVYVSQNKFNLSILRCYLHYNNQLPPFSFNIKVNVKLQENIFKHVTVHYNPLGKIARSLSQINDRNVLQ